MSPCASTLLLVANRSYVTSIVRVVPKNDRLRTGDSDVSIGSVHEAAKALGYGHPFGLTKVADAIERCSPWRHELRCRHEAQLLCVIR